MREPPPLTDPPGQRYLYLARGLFMLLIGMVFEAVMRPVVPWNYVPGALILTFGLGIGVALFERYYLQFGPMMFLTVAAGTFVYTRSAETSVLPLFLFAGGCDLARFGLRLQTNS